MDVSEDSGYVIVDQTIPTSYPYIKTFNNGVAVVALEAVPSYAHVFSGWSGDLSGKNNPEYILMDCEKTVTANFSLDWKLIGTFAGCLVLVIFLASVLYFRRKAPDSTAPDTEE